MGGGTHPPVILVFVFITGAPPQPPLILLLLLLLLPFRSLFVLLRIFDLRLLEPFINLNKFIYYICINKN
jgi:hypothetical protein